MRRTLATIACGVLMLGATACESTEQESARLGREGKHLLASQGTLQLGAANPRVHVSDVTLLSVSGRTAVAARLTGVGDSSQVNVPVLVDVLGANGKSLYSNSAGGLDPSLQRVGLLRPGRAAWWVDDQILTAQSPSVAHVRVGSGSRPVSGSLPAITASVVSVSSQAGLSVVNGKLVNHSARAQKRVPVFAVATRTGRVLAAGRALVSMPGGSTAPVSFQIFLVGDPAGASVQLTVAPKVS
jgi:hypothetical protein